MCLQYLLLFMFFPLIFRQFVAWSMQGANKNAHSAKQILNHISTKQLLKMQGILVTLNLYFKFTTTQFLEMQLAWETISHKHKERKPKAYQYLKQRKI